MSRERSRQAGKRRQGYQQFLSTAGLQATEYRNFFLAENGPQYAGNLFPVLCTILGVKHLTTTEYYLQTNGQVERCNRTHVARIRHYADDQLTDWDTFVAPLTFPYNLQVHRFTALGPFELTLMRMPSGPATLFQASS